MSEKKLHQEPACCDHCAAVHEQAHKHENEHDHDHGLGNEKLNLILLILSGVLLVAGFLPFFEIAKTYLLAASVLLSGYPILISGTKNLIRLKFEENGLVLIAIICACIIGDLPEAAVVALFFRVGLFMEDFAVNRSKRSIRALSEIRVDTAHLAQQDGSLEVVAAESVSIGNSICIMPYERVPLDGVITRGTSTMDASAITGESLPIEAESGVQLLSGMLNGAGTVYMDVTNTFQDSAASRIIKMVEDAAERKGKTEKFITKIAKYYTPVVMACAVLLAVIPIAVGARPVSDWVYRALIFLVASCPCAMVLSVPLGFFAGIGAASKRNILVKGSQYVEEMNKIEAVVLDKTGTLTSGEFSIKAVHTAAGADEQEVLRLAASAEQHSNHPIAQSIVRAYPDLDQISLEDYQEIPARGVQATIEGHAILCGGARMMNEAGIDISMLPDAPVYVARSGLAIGCIEVKDTLRPEAQQAIADLKKLGVKKVYMLTGDNENAAKAAAEECGLDGYFANLLPDQKVKMLEKIRAEYGKVLFVGDGINDSPVLTFADVGAAMGMGTDAALECADMVLVGNNLSKLPEAFRLFRKTLNVVKFNMVFALAVKAIVLLLGALGLASMWAAVFADVGVSIIAVANSARLLRGKREAL